MEDGSSREGMFDTWDGARKVYIDQLQCFSPAECAKLKSKGVADLKTYQSFQELLFG